MSVKLTFNLIEEFHWNSFLSNPPENVEPNTQNDGWEKKNWRNACNVIVWSKESVTYKKKFFLSLIRMPRSGFSLRCNQTKKKQRCWLVQLRQVHWIMSVIQRFMSIHSLVHKTRFLFRCFLFSFDGSFQSFDLYKFHFGFRILKQNHFIRKLPGHFS